MGRSTAVALVLLCAAQLVASGLWLSHDEGVQFTDAAYHYSQVIDLRNAVLGGSEALASLAEHDEKQRYGSLWYVLAVGVSLVTGPEAPPLLFGLSLLLWPLLIFGAFQLGALLAPPERREASGLLSAALIGLLPGIFNYSRTLVLDLPLTAAVLWAVVFLLRFHATEAGSRARKRAAWGLGVATVAALSLKVNAAAFLLGPALAIFWPEIRQAWRSSRVRFLQGIGVGFLGLAGLSAWLMLGSRGPALRETLAQATWPGAFFSYLSKGTLGAFPGHYLEAVWGLSWEMTYYTVLQSFTPLLALPMLAAYFWYFGRRRGCEEPLARRQRAAMFGWFIVPTLGLLLALRGLYDERYLLPLLPQAAALTAVALVELPRPRLRAGLAALILGGGLLGFGFVGFDLLPSLRPAACLTLPGWTQTERVGGSLWTCAAYADYRFMDRPAAPSRQNWAHDEMEAVLTAERDRLGRPLKAIFLDDLYELFYRAFQRDLLQEDLYRHEDMLLVTQCWDEAWVTSVWGSTEALAETIDAADVLLMRWGSLTDSEDTRLRGRRCTLFNPERFRLQSELPLADGTSLRIYFRD